METEYSGWKTGNWRPIKRWRVLRSREIFAILLPERPKQKKNTKTLEVIGKTTSLCSFA